MGSDWRTCTVAELQQKGILLVEDGNHGENRPRSHEIGEEGRAHIRAADLLEGRIDFEGAQRITDEASARIKKGQGRPLDVILSHKGTVGRVAMAPRDCEPFVCSPQTTLWRARDPTRLDPWYLYAQIRSPLIQRQLRQVKHESDMAPYVSLTAQRAFLVTVPSIETQRAISGVLNALDDKIESNRRLAVAQEGIAAALTYSIARFAGSPHTWSCMAFADTVEIDPRVKIVKGTRVPFIEMASVDHFATRPSEMREREFSSGSKFEPGDTLMARITGCIEHGKGAFVDFIDRPGAGSTEFLVFRAKPPLSPEAVFFLLRDPRLRAHAIASMSGTSGRQRVDKACFGTINLALAPDSSERRDALRALERAMRASRALWHESRTLTAIRDALLPRLVSGQIRVPLSSDPEEQLGAAIEALA